MIKLFFKAVIVSVILVSTFISTVSVEAKDNQLVLNNTTNNNVNTTDVITALKNSLLSINYDSETVINTIAPTYYTSTEKLNKKQEIGRRVGRVDWYNIPEAEVIAELKKESIYKLPYQTSFNTIKNNIEDIITRLINKDKERASASLRDTQFYINLISNNKEAFLIGLSYINTMYDFNFGSTNLKDNILYNANSYGNDVDVLNTIINLGKMQSNDYLLNRNDVVFNKYLANNFNSQNLIDFIEKNRAKYVPNTTTKEWFKNTSKAIILENNSEELSTVDVSLYNKLANDTNFQSHILPLLIIPENTLFVISNITSITYGNVDTYVDSSLKTNTNVYSQKIEELKVMLEYSAKAQRRFIDTWLRIAKPEDKNDLISNRIVIDTFRKYSSNLTESAEVQWSKEYGDDAISGVKHFFTPMKLYVSYKRIGAEANGQGFRMYMGKILNDEGISTYSHEITHLLDEEVWFNNQKIRDGFGPEFYARGLFETFYQDKPLFSLNMMFDRNINGFSNTSPERFSNAQDLKTYMTSLLDVIYTLNYLEGDIMLSKNTQEKEKWFNVIEQVDRVSTVAGVMHKEDNVRKITTDEVNNLSDFNSLIDNNIIASRYEVVGRNNTGRATYNGYYTIPYFTPIYGAPTNTNGVSGDLVSRKYAFDLLGEYGYFEGMVPFISNQYKDEAQSNGNVISDQYLINKISSGTYQDMASFEKAMFAKRVNKLNQLKEIQINYGGTTKTLSNVDDIKNIMKEAIEKDLANSNNFISGYSRTMPESTEIEKVKAEIFKAYKVLTNDFKSEIYKDVVSSNTLYVTRGDENSTLGDGSQINPYQSLSYALEKAKDGDTIILVDDILYRDQGNGIFTINKNVTIEGNNHRINFRGQNLETLANVKFSNLTLNMIPNGTEIPKIYASGNEITFENVSTLVGQQQSDTRPMIIGGTKDNATQAGSKTVINIIGGSSETRFNKIVAGNEFEDSNIPVEININSDFAKVDNGIILGGENGRQTLEKVVVNSNSKEIKKIDGENSVQNEVVLKKNNIYGVLLENIKSLKLEESANVVLSDNFNGNLGNIDISTGTQLKINKTGNISIQNISGNGEIVISPNTNIKVLENIKSPVSIKINGLGANFSNKNDNVYVDVLGTIQDTNMSVTIENNQGGQYIEKVNNQYILRLPKVKLSMRDASTNTKTELTPVVRISNNAQDYFDFIVDEITDQNYIATFKTASGIQKVYDNNRNLSEVIFDVKKVGKLIIDGVETYYSIIVDDDGNQIVKYRVDNSDGKVFVYKGTDNEFSTNDYNRDITLSGDSRFSNIELVRKDTTNNQLITIEINKTGQVYGADGNPVELADKKAIFNIGNKFENGFKDLEYTVYSDANKTTALQKETDVYWTIEPVYGFEDVLIDADYAGTLNTLTTRYVVGAANINKTTAVKSGIYKVTATLPNGENDWAYVVVPGDVDRDSIVATNDGEEIIKYASLEDINSYSIKDAFTLILSDVDFDEFVTTNDGDIVIRMVIGKIESN